MLMLVIEMNARCACMTRGQRTPLTTLGWPSAHTKNTQNTHFNLFTDYMRNGLRSMMSIVRCAQYEDGEG